jgi:hypothetical protein
MLGYLNKNLKCYDMKQDHEHFRNGMIRMWYLPLQGICLPALDLQQQRTWRTSLGRM